jgi:hypothetical protein
MVARAAPIDVPPVADRERKVTPMNRSHQKDELRALIATGHVWLSGPFAQPQDAWREMDALLDALEGGGRALQVIGDFVLPPIAGPPSRDFQTLHFDFGLPLVPALPADVARFTALHIPGDVPAGGATTRLVPLEPLLAARVWPDRDDLLERLAAYGRSHGAWDDEAGYVEGSLARLVEAALGETPALPSVKTREGFLCGTEFASLDAEAQFFAQRGLRPEAIEIAVCLKPGELLVFDNLRVAHGRRGTRRPGELRQRVLGHRNLPVHQQVQIRDRVLTAFR